MIYFYNNFHNGDIHYSRTFVKDIMNKLGDNDYCYLHNCDPSILKDIKKLKHNNSFISFDNWNLISDYPIKHNSQIIRTDDNFFINTWVGQKDMSYIHTDKDISCSLYAHYNLYKDIYNELSIPIEDIEYYIPEIDFNNINKSSIDKFISNNKYEKIILIANNIPRTVRMDLDLNLLADKLSIDYPNVLIALTNKTELKRSNVLFIGDLISEPNLNEISYFSKFCNIIVGFPSGPYVFTMIKDNLFEINKTFITISDNIYDSYYFESKSEMLHLIDHNMDNLYEILKNKQ